MKVLRRGCWVLLAALCLFYGAVAAAAPGPNEIAPRLQEEQLLLRWLRHSPEVASWRSQIGAARFDVLSARLWSNPELSVSGIFLLEGTPPDGNSGQQIQLTLPLPIFGQIAARRAAAESAVNVAEANVMALLWSRASDIQVAMVERAFADANRTMLQQNLTELERIEHIVGLRASAGANSQYDVLRVATAAATMQGALSSSFIGCEQAEAHLLALIADATLTSAAIEREGLTSFQGPEDETLLLRVALQRRPDFALARRGVVAARTLAQRYERETIPVPSVFGAAYLVQKQSGFQVTGGVSFPLPIFDRNQGLIGRSLVEAQGQTFLVQTLETRIRAEILGSWRARQRTRTALDQFRRQGLSAANELLKRAEVTYQTGRFSITELFDAYQTIWDARTQELNLQRQRADAEAELERAAVLLPVGAVTKPLAKEENHGKSQQNLAVVPIEAHGPSVVSPC